MNIKRILLMAGRLGVAALFLYAGYAKLSQPWPQFAVAIDSFKMVPDNLLEPMARTLPWIEVAAGVGLLVPVLAPWSALLTSILLVIFNAAGISAYARGLAVDRGFFGAGSADPIGPKWFVEHGAMLLLSVAVTAGCFLLLRARGQSLPRSSVFEVPEGGTLVVKRHIKGKYTVE
jgi:uncharacterized membrane protein YphA (DoxX/SURF4 family)